MVYSNHIGCTSFEKTDSLKIKANKALVNSLSSQNHSNINKCTNKICFYKTATPPSHLTTTKQKDSNLYGQELIDIAYIGKKWDAVLLLLEHGHPFPKDFNLENIPQDRCELLELIQRADFISSLIAKGKIEQISELINNGELKHDFKNLSNQSAVIIAFLNRQFEIYALLKLKGYKEYWYENPIDINELSVSEKLILKNMMASLYKQNKSTYF